jgi:hypothetical protein
MSSWADRLNAPAERATKPVERNTRGMRVGEIMLLPTARDVDEFVRTIPKGQSMTPQQLRLALAARHGTDNTCPVTLGYHLRTMAEAAHEAIERGLPLEQATPFWRVLDAKAPTTGRLACGADFVAKRRRSEGLTE